MYVLRNTILITVSKIATRLNLRVLERRFLTDRKFFVINVTKLGIFRQNIPQCNINTIQQNDPHFMFYPTV